MLNPLLGQTPRRVLAELHLLVPQQSQDPSQPQNVGTVIDLPKLTNPDHVLPQEASVRYNGKGTAG